MEHRKQYIKIITASLFLIIAYPADANEDKCSRDEAIAADAVTGYLDSWKNMHLAYTQYKKCDDGGIAEGFSEASARLLADHWIDVPKLLPLIAKDPAFGKWVITHLDETDNYDDLIKIDHLAQTSCPKHAGKFCEKIHSHFLTLGKADSN